MPEECIKVFVRVRPFTEKETVKSTLKMMQTAHSFLLWIIRRNS